MKSIPPTRGRLPFLVAWLAGSLSLAASTYEVRHNFTLRPHGNVVPQVQAVYYAHAWAQTFRPDCADWDVQPGAGAQPVGWGAFGTDRLTSQGAVRHRDGAASVLATQARVNVPAAGLATTTWTANAQRCANARAQANSEITVNPFGAGTAVTGTIRVHGFATAVAPPPRRAVAYAFSMAMVEARGGRLLRNGTIRWGKVVRDVVSDSATARRQVDPIDYTVTDLVTGEVATGTLLTVEVDLPSRRTGGFIWDNDQVQITASNVTFHVALPSTLTSLQGELRVEVAGGVVTNAVATGHFAGLAPAVGAGLPLLLAVPNEIEFDYDLGDFGGHDLDVGLDLHGAGETAEEAASDVPWLTIATPDLTTITVEHFLTEEPWLLEQTPTLRPDAPWTTVTVPPILMEDRVIYRLPRSPSAPAGFFRLRKATGPGDTEPPTFQVAPQCGSPMLTVMFSEPVALPTASDPAHYQLMALPPATVQVIEVQPLSAQSVRLFLNQPLQPGRAYVLQMQGVTDLAGNVIPPGSSVTFECP